MIMQAPKVEVGARIQVTGDDVFAWCGDDPIPISRGALGFVVKKHPFGAALIDWGNGMRRWVLPADFSKVERADGIPTSAALAFGVIMFNIIFLGPGLIFGTGPFAAQLIEEGYIENPDAIAGVFTGAMLMFAIGGLASARILGDFGPNVTAQIGVAIEFGAMLIFAFLPKNANTQLITFAYGMIGCGSFMIFQSSFSFVFLFEGNYEFADAMIGGNFNSGGFVFMLMSIPSVSFKTFFRAYLVVVALGYALILVFYPSIPYSLGDKARMFSARCTDVRNPCTSTVYKKHWKRLYDTLV
jgi:hypothetical protein